MQVFGDGTYQRGRYQRLVALHIHHDGVVRPPRCSTTSAIRSVPLAWLSLVRQALKPCSCTTLAIA